MAVVGATASGKSHLAWDVARQRGDVEIVSVDSMAVYREMDLATAKPSPAEQAAVPHHLLDVLDPSEECSVSLFRQMAEEAIDAITAKAKLPLLVGGTGLYHRAVIDQLAIPPQFPELRRQLDEEVASDEGLALAFTRLVALDPRAASRIEPTNARRVARALEVTLGTGEPFSSFGPGLETYPEASVLQIGLEVDLEVIDRAIEARVTRWMDEGLLDEVRSLADRPRGMSRTARQAIGYRELLGVIEEGRDLPEALEVTRQRTRALARRQRSWFRRDPRVRWVGPDELPAALGAALDRLAESPQVRD